VSLYFTTCDDEQDESRRRKVEANCSKPECDKLQVVGTLTVLHDIHTCPCVVLVH